MASDKKKKRKIVAGIIIGVAVLAVAAVVLAIILGGGGGNMSVAPIADPDTVWTRVSDLGSTSAAPETCGEGYKRVAESANYAMYLFEDTMSIKLLNKATGEILESTLSDEKDDGTMNQTWKGLLRSGLNGYIIRGSKNSYTVDLVRTKHTLNYKYVDNGFVCTVYFTEYGLGFDVQVLLDGDSLVATIPHDSVKEEVADVYLCTVSLFPYLGYTYANEEAGYMFVPDGNGALIYLQDTEGRFSSAYSQLIYGSDYGLKTFSSLTLLEDKYKSVNDPDPVVAPVFGMAHTDSKFGYLAVVEKGDERASIEAQPAGVTIDYNRSYARFYFRDIYVQPLNNSNSGTVIQAEPFRTSSDMQIRWLLLSGDEATYTGMALAYREYLLENSMLSSSDTTYRTRVDLLGSDNEEWLAFKNAVPMTTVDQAREIYDKLQELGVTSMLSVYKGWQAGGINSWPIDKYKVSSAIGGTGDLTSLIKDSAKEDILVYLYVNAMLANPDESNTTFNTVKKINKRRLEVPTYGQVYSTMNYLLPTKALSMLEKLVNGTVKKDVANIALAGVTNNLYSFTYNGNAYNRKDTQAVFEEMVKETAENANLILESPFAYLWNNVGAYLDMPLESSHYMYLDEEVPFLSIVLKGSIPMYSDYVNFEANKQEFFLRMVECGIYPSFYLTYEDSSELIYTNSSDLYSTLYETYLETVAEYDAKLKAVAEATGTAKISNHEKLTGGLVKVTYDNGVIIYVNYTEDALSDGSVTVEGLSYKVVN